MEPTMDDEQSQFIAAAREIVEKLYRDVEQLRTGRSHGPKRRELAARIFRLVHTLKGSAGSLGLKSVSQIAHAFESVLDGIRLGRIEITDAVLDAFEDAADAIARALPSAPSETNEAGAAKLIERLNGLSATREPQVAIPGTLRAALPPEIARSLSEYDLQHTREAVDEGAKLFIVSASFAIETFDQKFRELTKVLGQSGEVISTVTGEPATADEINFRLLFASELLFANVLRQAGTLGHIELREIEFESSAAGAKASRGSSPLPARPSDKGDTGESPSVRIEMKQIDELISSAGELFRFTTNALQSLSATGNKQTVDAVTVHLRQWFIKLEEQLIKLRLVPAGEILERAAVRAGRIAARQMGKQVEFEIAGGDVGIDKSLADIIADPLFHLVRNAVTHGIETPEERVTHGKSVTGRVRLAAFNEGSRIHITVTDDGRGIDWDRIAAAAAEQGIARNGSDLSTDQCLRLIFRPGFSTAHAVSELSGRGIGLDVVDRAMELAGGEVRVATEPGAGTTFAMIMPATLALVQCVVVQSGDQLYAIESEGVSDSDAAANQTEIDETGNRVDWRGESLPLLSLRTLLGQTVGLGPAGPVIIWRAPDNTTAAQTVKDGGNRYALVVDGIRGRQETLVRSLGRHAARWAGVCGAAELFDGNVALVLDLRELIKAQVDS
jgi:two-component system chemotaxis sensor kinase CheA